MRIAGLPAALALLGTVLLGAWPSASAVAQGNTPVPGTVTELRFRVQVVPAYEGKLRMNQTAPMVVRIENLGADAGAEILVDASTGGTMTHYPVALPSGAKKEIPILVPGDLNTGEITVSTDRGVITVPAIRNYENARASVMVIGDDPGNLAFLQTLAAPKPKSPQPYAYNDSSVLVTNAYLRPEALPPSEAAIDRTACVALMSGSERLSAPQIAAVRRYVLRGGHLVLFGGASSPILTDARLADLVPYSSLTPGEITVAGSRVSIQRPTPIRGAALSQSGGVPIVRRAYGAGRVTLFSADPTDAPFRAVSGRAKLVANALDLQRSSILTGTWLQQGPEGVQPGLPGMTHPNEVDPFSLPIPPTRSILYVLGAYFLVVLPVNFLILRGLKRLELAWFTAPLLALGFAGVLFRNAGSLYSTGLSHATRAVVFAGSGGREGLVLGKGQIFFPGAGRGPIPIEGAEAIGVNLFRPQDEYPYYRRQETVRSIDVIVTDRPSVPSYGSSALEFRDLDFHQTMDLGQGVRVIQSNGPRGPRIEVFNGSPHTLQNVMVIPAKVILSSGRELPGSSPTQSVPGFRAVNPIAPGARALCDNPTTVATGSLPASMWATSPVMIAGVEDAPLGPRLGTIIHARSWTQLVVSGEVR